MILCTGISCQEGQKAVAYQVNLLLVVLASHLGTGSSLS